MTIPDLDLGNRSSNVLEKVIVVNPSGPRSGRRFIFLHFIFEPTSGELYCNGKPRRLADQSAKLLCLFLENPHKVLTRDDIRLRLWPEHGFLEYDQSINRAVSQLRISLRGISSKSRLKTESCIETLPKVGYRFVPAVILDYAASNGSTPDFTEAHAIQMPNEEVYQSDDNMPADSSMEMIPAEDSSAARTSLTVVARHNLAAEPSDTLASVSRRVISERRTLPIGRTDYRFAAGIVVCILILLAASIGAYLHRTATHPPITLGIAPFETTGRDAVALAESFRFDLADSLSHIPHMRVVALRSLNYPGRDSGAIPLHTAPRTMDLLIMGQLVATDGKCQLQLELVRAADGTHLLSLHYDGKREELASIRDHVERDVFEELKPSLQSDELIFQKTASPAAYDSYLKGRAYLAQSTDESFKLAIESFKNAIQKDPKYARAYAGAASAYYRLSERLGVKPNDYLERARGLAKQSISIDDSLAEPHEVLGEIAMARDWDFARAEEQFHRAIELDPSSAEYHQGLALLYCVRGSYGLASQEIGRARAVDPARPSFYLTEIYIAAADRQFDRADRIFAELLEKMPNWSVAHEDRGLMLWESKRYEQAIEEWHTAAILDKDSDRAQLEDEGAAAFRQGGVAAYARVRLQAIGSRKGTSYEQFDFEPAEWNAYAGNREQTLVCLQAIIDRHGSDALEIATNPAYDSLHHDPRFLALVRRVGLPVPAE